jgi:hypothetical protein
MIEHDPAEEMADGTETMEDSELVTLLRAHEAQAIGYQPGGNDEISSQQERALNYYYGQMDDVPAEDGSSSVVDTTVSTIVDAALAATLRPFVSSDETVRFAPRQEEDVELAEQATEYVNYVFNCDNPGFQIMHDWFKDALLSKLGVVKVWWEDTSRTDQHPVQINDEMHGAYLRMQPEYMGEQDGIAYLGKMVEDGRVRVVNVPPEEFRISPLSRNVQDALYVAHVPSNVTRSDLVDMGFDPEIVEGLPAFSESKQTSMLQNARYADESMVDGGTMGLHRSQDRMAFRDEFIRVDANDDGVSELIRVCRVEDVILFKGEVEDAPFPTLCPIPMPHKVYGLSLADLAIESQKISTVLLRQILDNLYKSNNPRPVIGEGAWLQDGTTGDSLMDNAPGASVQVKDISQFRFDAVPFTSDKSFGMLQYVEQQIEQRTGVSQSGQGLDAGALKKTGQMTATEMAMMQGAKNARVEMIARIFAETGVKRLFQLILGLVTKHQQQERVIRLRNKWIPVNPSDWPEFDVSISVGLGIGDKTEQIMQADAVLQTMAELGQTPYATLLNKEKVYNAVRRKFVAAGIKNVDEYLVEPDPNEQPQEAQPDPAVMQAQAEMQMQQAKLQGEQAMAQAKLEMQVQEQQQRQQLAREQAEFEAELAHAKAQREADLAEQKFAMEAAMAERQMQFEATLAARKTEQAHEANMTKVELSANRPGGSLSE